MDHREETPLDGQSADVRGTASSLSMTLALVLDPAQVHGGPCRVKQVLDLDGLT
jgi:hypothetical protein